MLPINKALSSLNSEVNPLKKHRDQRNKAIRQALFQLTQDFTAMQHELVESSIKSHGEIEALKQKLGTDAEQEITRQKQLLQSSITHLNLIQGALAACIEPSHSKDALVDLKYLYLDGEMDLIKIFLNCNPLGIAILHESDLEVTFICENFGHLIDPAAPTALGLSVLDCFAATPFQKYTALINNVLIANAKHKQFNFIKKMGQAIEGLNMDPLKRIELYMRLLKDKMWDETTLDLVLQQDPVQVARGALAQGDLDLLKFCVEVIELPAALIFKSSYSDAKLNTELMAEYFAAQDPHNDVILKELEEKQDFNLGQQACEAVRAGNLELLKDLIETKGVYPDFPLPENRPNSSSLLGIACESGNLEIAIYLERQGAKFSRLQADGVNNALKYAENQLLLQSDPIQSAKYVAIIKYFKCDINYCNDLFQRLLSGQTLTQHEQNELQYALVRFRNYGALELVTAMHMQSDAAYELANIAHDAEAKRVFDAADANTPAINIDQRIAAANYLHTQFLTPQQIARDNVSDNAADKFIYIIKYGGLPKAVMNELFAVLIKFKMHAILKLITDRGLYTDEAIDLARAANETVILSMLEHAKELAANKVYEHIYGAYTLSENFLQLQSSQTSHLALGFLKDYVAHWHKEDLDNYLNACREQLNTALSQVKPLINKDLDARISRLHMEHIILKWHVKQELQHLEAQYHKIHHDIYNGIMCSAKLVKRKIYRNLAATIAAMAAVAWIAPQLASLIKIGSKGLQFALLRGCLTYTTKSLITGNFRVKDLARSMAAAGIGWGVGEVAEIQSLISKEFVNGASDAFFSSLLYGDVKHALQNAAIGGTVQFTSTKLAGLMGKDIDITNLKTRALLDNFLVGFNSAILNSVAEKAVYNRELDFSMALISGLNSALMHMANTAAAQQMYQAPTTLDRALTPGWLSKKGQATDVFNADVDDIVAHDNNEPIEADNVQHPITLPLKISATAPVMTPKNEVDNLSNIETTVQSKTNKNSRYAKDNSNNEVRQFESLRDASVVDDIVVKTNNKSHKSILEKKTDISAATSDNDNEAIVWLKMAWRAAKGEHSHDVLEWQQSNRTKYTKLAAIGDGLEKSPVKQVIDGFADGFVSEAIKPIQFVAKEAARINLGERTTTWQTIKNVGTAVGQEAARVMLNEKTRTRMFFDQVGSFIGTDLYRFRTGQATLIGTAILNDFNALLQMQPREIARLMGTELGSAFILYGASNGLSRANNSVSLFIQNHDFRSPMTFRFEAGRLNSGIPFDQIDFRNPIVKKTTPEKQIGPSGKPKIHRKQHKSKKDAREAAQLEGHGKPELHASQLNGDKPHFHPTSKDGTKATGGTHHYFPGNNINNNKRL